MFPGNTDTLARSHYIGTVDQLFIPNPPGSIITAQCSSLSVRRETFSNNFSSVHLTIQTDQPCIPVSFYRFPCNPNLLHCIRTQPVIGIQTQVQFRLNRLIGGVVRYMHPAIFLINILDFKVGCRFDPLFNQRPRVIRGTIIYHQPYKCLTTLGIKAFIHSQKRMRPVIGGGKKSSKTASFYYFPFHTNIHSVSSPGNTNNYGNIFSMPSFAISLCFSTSISNGQCF